jgi:hypothetical protein
VGGCDSRPVAASPRSIRIEGLKQLEQELDFMHLRTRRLQIDSTVLRSLGAYQEDSAFSYKSSLLPFKFHLSSVA